VTARVVASVLALHSVAIHKPSAAVTFGSPSPLSPLGWLCANNPPRSKVNFDRERVGQFIISMAPKKPHKKNRGRTTTAVATANSITATLFGSVINMGVTAITSGSVLLCLFAAKRLI